MKQETIRFDSGDVTLIPTKAGAGVYVKNKKELDLSFGDAQSLMTCFLDFANYLMPKQTPVIKGVRKAKTSKHKNK